MMKNKSPKYSSIDNGQTSQNFIENKYFNHKLNKSYKSFIQKRNLASPSPSNNTIETDLDKSIEATKKYNITFRPENKEYYEMGSYCHNEKECMKRNNNIIRINLKPFNISSHKNDINQNIQYLINKLNNSRNAENINNRSNYSFFESKYISADKKEGNKTNIHNNSNHSIIYSNDKDNKQLNQALNNNLERSQLTYKNLKNKYEIFKSPSIKIENDLYDKSLNDKFNTLKNASPYNRNIILRNSGNIRPYKNKIIKTIIKQESRSPIIDYNKEKILNLKNTVEKEKNKNLYDKNQNIIERSILNKTPDCYEHKKLIFVNPKHRTEMSYQNIEDKNIEIEPYNLNTNKKSNLPTDKKYSKNNKILDDKKNKNPIRVSIRNKYKDFIQNLDFNINAKPKFEEHYKRKFETLNNNYKNEMKNDKEKLKEENNLNSNNKEKNLTNLNNSIKSIKISLNDINKKSGICNNNAELHEKTQNVDYNNGLNKILLNNKNYVEENKYMKEIENIKYDNNTESMHKVNYNPKEIINNQKKLSNNDLSKGIIWKKKEINNNINNKLYIKKNNKANNNLINHQNYNNIFSANVKVDSLEHNKKSNNDGISFSKINRANNNININNNRNWNTSTLNNIQTSNVKTPIKTESDSNLNYRLKNLLKKLPINTLNQTIKMPDSNSLSKLGVLEMSELNKNQKLNHYRNLSESPKHMNNYIETDINGHKRKEEKSMKNSINRKTTYDIGNRYGNKKNKIKKEKDKYLLNDEFSSMISVKKCEALSLPGKNEKGKKKINQDSYLIVKNLNRVSNFNIFGVLDGHGDDGHYVSQFVKSFIIQSIKNHPSIKPLNDPKEIYKKLIANNYELISNIFIDADIQIQKEKFDSQESGTTIVLVIQLEEHVICANAGDSRAIAIYDENFKDNKFFSSKIYPLSFDCKPELPNEKKRIYKCGGVVEKSYDTDEESDEEIHIPFRVWAKGENYPGLAMSRSIGDIDAKRVGVIPNPQIVEYIIGYSTKYILVCSDGIWEFLKNEDCMKIGNEFYIKNDPIGLCQELSKESIKLWEKKELAIDDITIVVVFY